jgi:DNA-binding MarR family transcriptional regulator
MATYRSDGIVEAIGYAITRWQDAVETFDDAVGKMYDLSGAERRCLSVLSRGPRLANEVACDANLTPSAATTLIDRLEKRGFVRRTTVPSDRRKVMVEAAEATDELIQRVYRPVFEAGAELLSRYKPDELTLIHRFVEDIGVLQNDQLSKLGSGLIEVTGR